MSNIKVTSLIKTWMILNGGINLKLWWSNHVYLFFILYSCHFLKLLWQIDFKEQKILLVQWNDKKKKNKKTLKWFFSSQPTKKWNKIT